MNDENVSIDFINECFFEKSGDLYWNKRPLHHFVDQNACNAWNARSAGKRAGNDIKFKESIRRQVSFTYNGIRHKTLRYRILFAIKNRRWPKGKLDHKNRNSYIDNHENIRECNSNENQINSKMYKSNRSGYRGVSYIKSRNKWKSNIFAYGKNRFLGYYDSAEKAASVYRKAAIKFFGIFAETGVFTNDS